MGFKRQTKNSTQRCETCGQFFENYSEKIAYRIDKNGRYTKCNTMIICKGCDKFFRENNFEDMELSKTNIASISRLKSLRGKIYRTRKKYENK